MAEENLRALIRWHHLYREEWDSAPERYVDEGVVAWGKSRRLGLLKSGPVKAYLGVQHVDPTRAGWGLVEQPEARFFASLFVGGKVVTLRTFGTLADALEWLRASVRNLL
jgi:hypothetical protein